VLCIIMWIHLFSFVLSIHPFACCNLLWIFMACHIYSSHKIVSSWILNESLNVLSCISVKTQRLENVSVLIMRWICLLCMCFFMLCVVFK
jgi:hypothetical protein